MTSVFSRRGFLRGSTLLACTAALPARAQEVAVGTAATPPQIIIRPTFLSTEPFSVEALVAEARERAASAYQPHPTVPQEWLDLTYDQYRLYWFNSQRALWAGEPGALEVDFFHPGLYFPRGVDVFAVEDGEEGRVAKRVAFDLALFDRTDKAPDLPIDESMGFSGIRLRSELNTPGIHTEFAVFQGASYFRLIARGLVYGLSARGIAVNTAEPDGEEFPEFTKLYVEHAAPGADTFRVHAILDGPSVAGAYSFTMRPGDETIVDVEATLFPRVDLDRAGLAPLTSMFLFDLTNRERFDDYRPGVHDSDGLVIHNGGGEAIWRPLANPLTLQISAFADESPRGFGLAQRSREFEDFGDLEAIYERRPSLWIEPGEDWGRGSVVLVEIPADKEIYDNIVAFWRPAEPLAAGSEHRVTYRMRWSAADAPETEGRARVVETRIGAGFSGQPVVAIHFEPHEVFGEDLEGIEPLVRAGSGSVGAPILSRNPQTGGIVLNFGLDPEDASGIEMRAQLLRNGEAISEVWLYRWTA